MKKLPSLSIFFPCYNDEHTIAKLIDDAYIVGKKVANRLQVIVIDDGSTDGSRHVLQQAQKKHHQLQLITHHHNRGYGGALRSGFKAAKNDFVFYTDGDGQYRVQDLSRLVSALTNNIDVVNGRKATRQDHPLRDIIGHLYYLWVKLLFNTPIKEIDTDFRLIRREKLDHISLNMDSGAICVELITKLHRVGAKFIEVTISHHDRQYGRSQFFTPQRIINTLIDDVKLWAQLRK